MKPENIFLVRHGESTGNVNREIYKTHPDYTLRLTNKGYEQALEAGKYLSELIEGPIAFYTSPFYRTRDTYQGIIEGGNLKDRIYTRYEDSRLTEQSWGQVPGKGFDEEIEKVRDKFGHYYFQFPGGESCMEVEDRISSFLNTLWREFDKDDFPSNVVIVTHGMTLRVFLKRFFKLTPEEFELLANPKNCEIVRIRHSILRNDSSGWGKDIYKLLYNQGKYDHPYLTKYPKRNSEHNYTQWSDQICI